LQRVSRPVASWCILRERCIKMRTCFLECPVSLGTGGRSGHMGAHAGGRAGRPGGSARERPRGCWTAAVARRGRARVPGGLPGAAGPQAGFCACVRGRPLCTAERACPTSALCACRGRAADCCRSRARRRAASARSRRPARWPACWARCCAARCRWTACSRRRPPARPRGRPLPGCTPRRAHWGPLGERARGSSALGTWPVAPVPEAEMRLRDQRRGSGVWRCWRWHMLAPVWDRRVHLRRALVRVSSI